MFGSTTHPDILTLEKLGDLGHKTIAKALRCDECDRVIESRYLLWGDDRICSNCLTPDLALEYCRDIMERSCVA